jgi:voltage-gated potassium channel
MLESIKELPYLYLDYFNTISIIIFTLEYLIRIYTAEKKWAYILSPMGLVDLAAILPFYIPKLISIDLRFLRVLRLMRFLRLLKINRYDKSLTLIWSVIKEKKPELMVTLFLSTIIVIISSFLMYYVEGEKQPEAFPNVLSAFWWAIATLTTVGYGDIYPVTVLGKFISGIMALVGIGIVALPTGLISAGFLSRIKQNKTCPHCGRNINEH